MSPLDGVEAYPLHWPLGVPRTPAHRRKLAPFRITQFGLVRDRLLGELRRLGAQNVILSTNLPTRQDGLPYANARMNLEDPGAAVYFLLKGKPTSMACDRWRHVIDNVHALELSIKAIRGLERWGSSDFVDRAFAGFAELPPAANDWRAVLGFPLSARPSPDDIERAWRAKAREAHPDAGGSHDAMVRLNEAREAALRELQTG